MGLQHPHPGIVKIDIQAVKVGHTTGTAQVSQRAQVPFAEPIQQARRQRDAKPLSDLDNPPYAP